MLNNSEKLYFLPNSVYWAEVTRSCNTSRCASTGLFFQASMRQSRILASCDMAGDKSFKLLFYDSGNDAIFVINYLLLVPRRFKCLSASGLLVKIVFTFQFKITAKIQTPDLFVSSKFFSSAVFEYFSFYQ